MKKIPQAIVVLLALVAPILFFGAVELVLWVGGVRTLAEGRDPFEGFSERGRVFRLDAERGVYETAPGAAFSFNEQRFQAPKPPESFRVFVLGGSSAYGFPWGARVAFPEQLRAGLHAVWPERTIEVINAGGMSYASHRLRILTHEVLEYEPDLLVIYGGHNEFIERRFYRSHLERPRELDALRRTFHQWRLYSALTRMYQGSLERGAEEGAADAMAEFDLAVIREAPLNVSDAEKGRVRTLFEENLRIIVELARRAGVPIVLCTVPSNVRDWAPDQSFFPQGTPLDDQRLAGTLLLDAQGALERGEARAALDDLQQALSLAPGHAGVHFQLGRAYEASGRWKEARTSYVRARDTDGSPTRAPSSFNETIRHVSSSQGVPLIDVEELFEAEAPHRLLGFDHFEDYVHPTPAAHGSIALALWTLLLEEGFVGEQRPAEPSVFHAAVPVPDPSAVAEGSDDPRMRAAQLFNLGVVLAKQGRDDQALEKMRAAAEILPNHAKPRLNIGIVLHRQGRDEEAVLELREALRLEPGHIHTHLVLGRSLYRLGRHAEAEEILQRAARAAPDSAPVLKLLGTVRYEQRRFRDGEGAPGR
jgi:tetratricopeptide (TPR) repeat protein